jgi:hypothetical protein
MPAKEQELFDAKVDFARFADTYFAPRRFVTALDWEHPSLARGFLRTRLSLMAQFDLSDEDLHSQYLTAQFALPISAFTFSLGCSLGLVRDSGDLGAAFAAEGGMFWTLPTANPSRLSLFARYASGRFEGGNVVAFLPITAITQSPILQPKIPATSMILLDYSARINRDFALSISSFYFIRTDLFTDIGYPVVNAHEGGYFLGNEFFGRIFWSPASDVHLNLGGGLFLPSLGNAASGLNSAWRIELGLAISLF